MSPRFHYPPRSSLPEIEASIISLTLSAGQNRNPETAAAAAAHMQ